MTAVRGPLGIRERQSDRYQMHDWGSMGGRSLTWRNISESDFNGNDESFQGFPQLIYHVTSVQSDWNCQLPS